MATLSGQAMRNAPLYTAVLGDLRVYGSSAAPGFMRPEGIIVYHTASKQTYKVTSECDGGKWMEAA